MQGTQLTRRGFLAVSGAAAATGLMAACGPGGGGASSGEGKINLTLLLYAAPGWSDEPKKIISAYRSAHSNANIELLTQGTNLVYPKMVAAKQTTPDDNYVDIGIYNAQTFWQGVADNMWDTVTEEDVPNLKHILPTYRLPNNRGICYSVEVYGLLYNKKAVPSVPDSWTDLWSPAYKGKVVSFDYTWDEVLMAAALNGGSAKDIDEGFRIWHEHAESFKELVTSNDQLKNLIESGDAALAPFSNDVSASYVREPGSPLGFAVPKEGGEARPLYIAITTGLKPAARKVATDFVNELLSPESAGRMALNTNLTSTSDNAILTEAQKNDPLTKFELIQNAIQVDWETVGKSAAGWHKRWDEEVKSQLH